MKLVNDSRLLNNYKKRCDFDGMFQHPELIQAALYYADPYQPLLAENETGGQMLYYLAAGWAKLYLTLADGTVDVLDFFQAPHFIGEMEFLDIRSSTLGVLALSPCYLIGFSYAQCRNLLLADCVFLNKLALAMGQKERRLAQTKIRNQSFSLASRLAAFLLESSGQHCHFHNTDIAAYLGVSYRHLTLLLANFTASGYIRKQGRDYLIENRPALEKLTEEIAQTD